MCGMERRKEVLRLQAELEAKKSELAHLQQRVHKAEVQSQLSGTRFCGAGSQHLNCDDNPSKVASHMASQVLVRSQTDPHSPIWISGEHYPAQYLIRQTRSMSKSQRQKSDSILTQMPVPSHTLPEKDFELPDELFLDLKLAKLNRTYTSEIDCELVKASCTPVKLKCIQITSCLSEKVCDSDGKLVVGSNGTFAISFNDGNFAVHQWKSGTYWSYPLAQAVICFDLVCTRDGVLVFAVSHSRCLTILTLTGDNWQTFSLPTNHLAWPSDYQCQILCMSELRDGSVVVAASCCEVVGVWQLTCADHWVAHVVSKFNIPLLSSLTLAEDLLLTTTSQHQVIVYNISKSSSSPLWHIALSCCPGLQTSAHSFPQLLAAKNVQDVLMIVLTHKPTIGACIPVDVAGWIIAVKNSIPFLLHTYRYPNTFQHREGRCELRVHAHAGNGWDLVGVPDNLHQLYVWRGPQQYPDMTFSLRATKGTVAVRGVYWDSTSDSCLVLDKLGQVHCFQNSDINFEDSDVQ